MARIQSAKSIPARIEARVVQLTAPGRLELRAEWLDRGSVGPRQLLCETLVTVISPGTELAAYTGLPALRSGTGYPRVQGYCNVARVLVAGSEVEHLRPGDRVLSFSSHRSHFILGADQVLLKLGEGACSADIACTYLFHLGYNAVLRSGVRAGSRVLVIGLGALGLTAVAMAAIAGAQVVGVSDHALPQGLAREFGASAVLPRSDAEGMRAALSASLADAVITTSNSWDDWHLALQSAAHRGTIAVLGFPGRGSAAPALNPLDSRYFYDRQLRIEAVGVSPERPDERGFLRFNERDNLSYLAALIDSARLKPAALIGGRYPSNDIEQAYRELLDRTRPAVTYLLSWNDE
jgi:D-arabinose 1-dehydrogenase-like Zn-dependent alcohol dehydrogenase